MSYDLTLYLKTAPAISPDAFTQALSVLGIDGELAPDFTMDGSISPLCAKLKGAIKGDHRTYLAVVDYNVEENIPDPQVFALPAPKKSKQNPPTLTVPAGAFALTFFCGMDHLELPFALMLCKLLANKDGILFDPQTACLAMGESDIALLLDKALSDLQGTPADRLLLHEFDEWI